MTEDIKVIKCGRLIDGTGSPPIGGTTILISGSKITAVGKNLKIPEGAEIIDASDKVVMPGLIDSVVHHNGIAKKELSEQYSFGPDEWTFRPRELGLIKSVFDSQAVLSAGYTTVKDCGQPNAVFLKKAAAEGTIVGIPRIVAAGYTLSQTLGHLDMHHQPLECVDVRTSKHQSRLEALICDGVPECIQATRYALRFGADFIAICTGGGVVSERDSVSDTQFWPEEIKAIVDTAAHVNKHVTAYCHNSPGVRNSVLAGVKVIVHATDMNDEVIALVKEHGAIFSVTVTPIKILTDPEVQKGMAPWAVEKAKPLWEMVINSYQRMRKAGAMIATSSSALNNIQNTLELEYLVEYCGFSPMEVIVGTTRNAAMACALGDVTGTIEPGKFADIIIIDGNPLQDIRILRDVEKIRMVMLEGRVEVDRGL